MTTAPVIERVRMRRRLPEPAVRRAIRIAAGASMGELAEAAAVSQRTIARWENGTANPRGERLQRYLTVLDELRSLP